MTLHVPIGQTVHPCDVVILICCYSISEMALAMDAGKGSILQKGMNMRQFLIFDGCGSLDLSEQMIAY